MEKQLSHFINNYGSPFFVGSLVSKKVVFVNKVAEKLFGVTKETCDFANIFDKSEERIEVVMQRSLHPDHTTLIYNFTAITGDKKKILVDLQVGFFNDEKTEVFLEVIPQHDTRMEMALHQIQNSPRAEAILNLDDKLSIVDCNEAFYKVFECNKELCQSHYKHDLVNGFSPDQRERIMADIHKTLETSEIFSTEIKVFTATGEEKWYRFDLQKRELDNSGMKLMCYMVNIEKQVVLEEKHSHLNQYFSAMQNLSNDIMFHIDLKKRVFTHSNQNAVDFGLQEHTNDFSEIFISKGIIHPDDIESYRKCVAELVQGKRTGYQARCAVAIGVYEWFDIRCEFIWDEEGNPIEIFGCSKNIHKEKTMQDEVSSLNHYMDAFQAVSNESFAIIDLEKKTLTQKGPVARELGVEEVLENFPQCTFDYTHPDDLPNFKVFTDKSVTGEIIRVKTRMKTNSGEYQWYEICSQGITDEHGNVTKLVGKIANIHKEKTMQEQVTSQNKYFDALQEFSTDILYRLDVPTLTLYHSFHSERATEVGNVIPDYISTLVNTKIVHPEDAEVYVQKTMEWLVDPTVIIEARFSVVTYDYEWYRVEGKQLFDENGNLVEIVGILVNIQKEKELVESYDSLNHIFTAMQELSDDILFRIDINENTFYHSNEETTKIGIMLKTENYVETFIANGNIHPDDVEHYRKCNIKLKTGELSQYEMRAEVEKGVYHAFDVKCTLISSTNGEPIEIFGRMKNIQQQKELEARASHDLMTQVLNKVSFEDSASTVLSNNIQGISHAIIFIDLDDFKGINDNLGHGFGDFLLTTVGKRLKRVVRETDLIGRLGGDEFAVMLKSIGSPEAAALRVKLLLDTLQRPFSFEGKTVDIKASIGFAIAPLHGNDYKKLIKKADIALYSSKGKGKNTATMYTEEITEK